MRRGVYSAGPDLVPLGLSETNGVSLPENARIVIVRKYVSPWMWFNVDEEEPGKVDWSRIYDRLRDHPEVSKLSGWQNTPHFFYFHEELYSAYRAKMAAPVPALIVPAHLFKKARDAIGFRQDSFRQRKNQG